MQMTDFRQRVDAFVAEPAIAVVGASRTGRKFGNTACRTLRARGYRVYPVHPDAKQIDGERCYAKLTDLPERVDAVLVSVPPAQAIDVLYDAADAGMHKVWLQQGAESPQAIDAAGKLHLDAVSGACVLMYARPTGIHSVHAWVWRLLGKSA